MSTKELPAQEAVKAGSIGGTNKVDVPQSRRKSLDVEGPTMGDLQSERRELARDFVTLKHTISQLREDRDRLAVENRDLKMRLAALNRTWFALEAANKVAYRDFAEANFEAYRRSQGFADQHEGLPQ